MCVSLLVWVKPTKCGLKHHKRGALCWIVRFPIIVDDDIDLEALLNNHNDDYNHNDDVGTGEDDTSGYSDNDHSADSAKAAGVDVGGE